MGGAKKARRAAVAASRAVTNGLTSWGYASFTADVTPPDITSLALTDGAGAVAVNSSARLMEGTTAGSDGSYFSQGRGPQMADGPYWVKASHGGGSSATDRGYGPGYSNADGSAVIFALFQSATCGLITKIGSTFTERRSQNNGSTTSSDIIEIRYSVSGADIVYTVFRGATQMNNLTWTDTGGAIFGVPGRYPAAVLKRRRAGSQYPSPGIDLIQAGMI